MTERKTFDLKEDLAIDLDNLHTEWAMHGRLRYDYAEEVNYLDKQIKLQKIKIEKTKDDLKEEIAKLTIHIKNGNPKATVQQIDATISIDKSLFPFKEAIYDAQKELINLEHDYNSAKNALKAMDDKKEGLENEVILWSRNYFSTPRERREVEPGKTFPDEIAGQKTQNHRQGINRRRRKTK